MVCRHGPFRRDRSLIALAVGGAVVEAAILIALGRSDDLALAAQLTALPPWGVLHDARWWLAFQPGWWTAAVELVALVLVRGAVTGAMVRAAWPDRTTRPSRGEAVRRGLAFTAGALLVVVPWAALLFGVMVTPVSWLWFAAAIPTVVVATVVNRGAIARQWWALPSLRTVTIVLVTVVVLSLTGAVAELAPLPLAVAAVALGGIWNAWAWQRFVHAELCVRAEPDRIPLGPITIAALVVIMLASATLAFDVFLARAPTAADAPAPTQAGRPVLVAGGFGTSFDGTNADVLPPPYADVPFSYAGIDTAGQPLPYDAEDTYAPLPELARLMAEQVDVLHARTGQPVDIVAESEGSLVAQLYALGAVDPPVGRVLLLSPLVRPARVHYPPRGQDGWGVGSGWLLRGMVRLVRFASPYGITADTPFVRSLVDHAPVVRFLYACRADGVDDEVAIISLADETTFPMDADSQIATGVVAAFHARFLTGDPAVIVALLEGGGSPVSPVSTPVHVGVRALSQAWQVPTVPLSLAWSSSPRSCGDVERWAELLLGSRSPR